MLAFADLNEVCDRVVDTSGRLVVALVYRWGENTMADDEQDPEEPTRPDDLNVDRRHESSPNQKDGISARAVGDILDDSTESLDQKGVDDIRGFATGRNKQAAAQAQAELDTQAEAEAEADAEVQASIDAEGKVRRAMMRLAVGIILFASVYGCTQIFGGDDDSAQVGTVGNEADSLESAIGDLGSDTADTGVTDGSADETDDAEDSSDTPEDETSDASDTTDAAAIRPPEDLFRPRFYTAMIDGKLRLWVRTEFFSPWGALPPEFFSGFCKLFLSVNPTAEVGWETHNGADYVLGITSEAYILDDGSVVFATDIFPTRPFVVSIDTSFGSWPDEAGPPAVFGEDSGSIDSDSIEEGDPFVDFGAVPVYDLVAGESI